MKLHRTNSRFDCCVSPQHTDIFRYLSTAATVAAEYAESSATVCAFADDERELTMIML